MLWWEAGHDFLPVGKTVTTKEGCCPSLWSCKAWLSSQSRQGRKELGEVAHACNLSSEKWKQEDWELKTNFSYIISSKPVWATMWGLVSKQQQERQQQQKYGEEDRRKRICLELQGTGRLLSLRKQMFDPGLLKSRVCTRWYLNTLNSSVLPNGSGEKRTQEERYTDARGNTQGSVAIKTPASPVAKP